MTGAWSNAASPGDTAVFAAGTTATGAYTVTVSGTQTVGGLTFEEGTVTLSGGQINLVGSPIFNTASNLGADVGSILTGQTIVTGQTISSVIA